MKLDDLPISPPQGFLIRKGPGSCFYDFAQELLFSDILRRVQLDSQLAAPIRLVWIVLYQVVSFTILYSYQKSCLY